VSITKVRKRTVTIGTSGGEKIRGNTVSFALTDYTRDHLHSEIDRITTEIVHFQLKNGNEPSVIFVDDSRFKPISEVTRKTLVLFGVELAQAVIRAVERALIQAIEISTNKRTGNLADINNWEWWYFSGKQPGRVVNPADIPSFGLDDVLILRPKPIIKYATVANQAVAGGRRKFLLERNPGSKRRGRKAQATNKRGFLRSAAEFMRRDPTVRNTFSVYAQHSEWTVDGETAKLGGSLVTGQIVFHPSRKHYKYR